MVLEVAFKNVPIVELTVVPKVLPKIVTKMVP